jgi:hypothetical protein
VLAEDPMHQPHPGQRYLHVPAARPHVCPVDSVRAL